MSPADRALHRDDPDFPRALLRVRPQPRVVFARGHLAVLERRMVAIVGSREPSPYGRHVAYEAAHACARAGLVVVSGMARGLDGQAHRGALDAGGLTIGVLGCGLDIPYPRQNLDLREVIPRHGLLLSEFPASQRPADWTFPRRNRCIAGLADCVLVVEGRAKGGTSNTVWWMLKLGKPIYAVPGRLGDPLAEAPNLLIQQGARIYLQPRDILEELGLAAPDRETGRLFERGAAARAELTGAEATLFDLITPLPVHVDDLAARAGLEPGLLLAALSGLELQGLVKQLPGKHVALAS